MKAPHLAVRLRLADKSGFLLPVIIVAIVLLGAMAVAVATTGHDEHLSARAMHESSLAFYAAEAGLNEVQATLDEGVLSGIAPGDSVALGGWRTLQGGSSYRAWVQRLDNGGQRVFALKVEGRGPGPRGGRRVLSGAMTWDPPGRYRLGQCCDAAVTIRGVVDMDGGARVDGNDVVPPGWEDVCPNPGAAKPGIIMADTTRIDVGNGTVVGDPPLAQDTTLVDSSFDQFGELSFEEIKAMADHVIDGEPQILADGRDGRPGIGPKHILDPNTNQWVCDTTDPYNWGSDHPNDPCFGYYPIILVKGEMEVHYGYGQAVIVIDWDESKPPGSKGGEFELETDFRFNGLILGKGCVEIQKGALFHGAVFVDANYRHEDLCAEDDDYDMNTNQPKVYWSQCAVDRAIEAAGLAEYAESEAEAPRPLPSRAFGEVLE